MATAPIKSKTSDQDGEQKSEVPATSEYKVAHGRTLVTDEGNKGPGEPVTLTAKEAKGLIALGFLVDPEGNVHARAEGPAVNVDTSTQAAKA